MQMEIVQAPAPERRKPAYPQELAVVAAPEFSLQPRTWCFPVAGCVSYRGYFSELNARKFAERLMGEGYDVHVGGVVESCQRLVPITWACAVRAADGRRT